jgi:hypothetical protein
VRREAYALLLVLSVVLAGCAGKRGEPDSGSNGPLATGEPGEETGAIEGRVQTGDLLPVAGAILRLLETRTGSPLKAETVARDDGAFAFSRQEPGTYRLQVNATGFTSQSQLVTVRAGQVNSVLFTLVESAPPSPYVAVRELDGLLSCAVAAVVAPSSGSCEGNNRQFVTLFEVLADTAMILVEANWDGASDHVAFYFYNQSRVDNVTVLSPLGEMWGGPGSRLAMTPGKIASGAVSGALASRTYAPVPVQPFTLNATAFYAGRLAAEANQTAGPVCENLYGRCAGAGAAVSLRYTVYVSMFLFQRPADLAGYSALPA